MRITKEDIYNCGKQLFFEKGFKDTNIADITKMAGIGVGTFYNFYSSKEMLFLEIFYKEDMELKKHVLNSIDFSGDIIKVAKDIIHMLFTGIRSNPVLKEWYNRDVYSKISKVTNKENLDEEDNEFSYNLFMQIIERWKEEGKIKGDLDSDLILAFFNSLSYIDLHKEEIGAAYFPEILDHFVEFIVKGIQ